MNWRTQVLADVKTYGPGIAFAVLTAWLLVLPALLFGDSKRDIATFSLGLGYWRDPVGSVRCL